jgi:hypothetical protein
MLASWPTFRLPSGSSGSLMQVLRRGGAGRSASGVNFRVLHLREPVMEHTTSAPHIASHVNKGAV